MDMADAQSEMRQAYLSGSTGIISSGLVWLAAGTTGIFLTTNISMLVLFFGGTLIYPLSLFLAKRLGASAKHAKINPLGKLALETLAILFVGLFLAFTVAKFQSALFFPFMLLIIGARYLLFQSLYGLKVYWVLGGMLLLAGFAMVSLSASPIMAAFAGAAIELIVGALVLRQHRHDHAEAQL